MKVTICTMNYNLGKYISEAITSVLAQTFTDFEYLIIDDASTDNSLEVIKGFNDPRITVIERAENSGSPDMVVNQALGLAQGEYFATLPSDDIWQPDFLEKIIGKLEKEPFYGSAACHVELIDESGALLERDHPHINIAEEPNRPREEWLKALYGGNRIRGGFVFRRSLEIGLFDTGMAQLSDLEFYIRCIKKAPFWVAQEKLMKVRIRGEENYSAPTDANLDLHIKNLRRIQTRHYRAHTSESLKGKLKLIIATPFYEMRGFSPYIVSLLKTARYLDKIGMDWEFWEVSGSSYVDRARNLLCAKFLESDATHLLFIDSDEDWDEKAIPGMIAADKDIIGGAYPQKNNWDTWSSIPDLKSGDIQGEVKNGNGLIEADVVSAGFMLIHRRALEKFEEHYPELAYADPEMDRENNTRVYLAFFLSTIGKQRYLGEDSNFCARYRAMGEKVWIYPDIDFGHYGIKGWYGNFAQALKNRKIIKNGM